MEFFSLKLDKMQEKRLKSLADTFLRDIRDYFETKNPVSAFRQIRGFCDCLYKITAYAAQCPRTGPRLSRLMDGNQSPEFLNHFLQSHARNQLRNSFTAKANHIFNIAPKRLSLNFIAVSDVFDCLNAISFF